MLSLPVSVRIYVARGAVDMRKTFDGLCALTRDALRLDPFTGHVFVFFNRRRDRIKLLLWERNGFWLLYKRLERGTFEVLAEAVSGTDRPIEIDARRLRLLLDGIDTKKSRFRRHFASDRTVTNLRLTTRGGAAHAADFASLVGCGSAALRRVRLGRQLRRARG
jgi:transposase